MLCKASQHTRAQHQQQQHIWGVAVETYQKWQAAKAR